MYYECMLCYVCMCCFSVLSVAPVNNNAVKASKIVETPLHLHKQAVIKIRFIIGTTSSMKLVKHMQAQHFKNVIFHSLHQNFFKSRQCLFREKTCSNKVLLSTKTMYFLIFAW